MLKLRLDEFYVVFTDASSDLSWKSTNTEKAFESWKKLRKSLELEKLKVAYLAQIHSNIIRKVERAGFQGPGDGLYTFKPNIGLVVFTADCIPLALVHKKRGFISILHCGWRPLAKGIIERLNDILKEHSISPEECQAFLGPCIGECCYTVGEDLKLVFPEYAFITDSGKLKMSLQRITIQELTKIGVRKIEAFDMCTYCSDNFFSYRRDRTKKRQIGLIIKKG